MSLTLIISHRVFLKYQPVCSFGTVEFSNFWLDLQVQKGQPKQTKNSNVSKGLVGYSFLLLCLYDVFLHVILVILGWQIDYSFSQLRTHTQAKTYIHYGN